MYIITFSIYLKKFKIRKKIIIWVFLISKLYVGVL